MALPIDNPTDKVKAVEDLIKKIDAKDLAALPGLDPEDFKHVGTLIQLFCFMDFNLRRALETFNTAKMLPREYQKLYPNLPDTQMTEALAAIIKEMDPNIEDAETAQTWIEVINETRKHRNLVAHFAGKRFQGHDVYVFISKCERDARKALGFSLGPNQMHTSVVGRSEFIEMIGSATSAQEWLAKKVTEWNGRYLKPAGSKVKKA